MDLFEASLVFRQAKQPELHRETLTQKTKTKQTKKPTHQKTGMGIQIEEDTLGGSPGGSLHSRGSVGGNAKFEGNLVYTRFRAAQPAVHKIKK